MLQNVELIRKYNDLETNNASLGEIREKEMGVLVFFVWIPLKNDLMGKIYANL